MVYPNFLLRLTLALAIITTELSYYISLLPTSNVASCAALFIKSADETLRLIDEKQL